MHDTLNLHTVYLRIDLPTYMAHKEEKLLTQSSRLRWGCEACCLDVRWRPFPGIEASQPPLNLPTFQI